MNDESSRSHLILSIIIESTNLQTQSYARGKVWQDEAANLTPIWSESTSHTFIYNNEKNIECSVALYLWPGHFVHIVELLHAVENSTPVI
jgi:hypothetical protein